MSKKAYPEFHKSLLEQSTYPAAARRIKFEETRTSLLYRTGTVVYKIRKSGAVYSSLAVKERFAREALRLGRSWAGDVVRDVVPVVRREGRYALGGEGEVVDYALEMAQLSDTYWLHRLLANRKMSQTAVGKLARFLSERHAAAALEEKEAGAGRPENFSALLEELVYQCKKYINVTLSQAMLDMIQLPLGRFLDESRKLMVRRMKRGHIVDGHGAFVPEHIHLRAGEVHAVAPLEAYRKFRVLDAANDVATLANALVLAEASEWGELFIRRYTAASKDRDLSRLLPAYQALQALRSGLVRSEWQAERPPGDKERDALVREAGAYFNLAVRMGRQIPKSA